MVENKVGVASKFGSLGLHTLRLYFNIHICFLNLCGGISVDGIVSCCSSLPSGVGRKNFWGGRNITYCIFLSCDNSLTYTHTPSHHKF